MSRLLVVTNDFPPRPGGIQAFVAGLLAALPPGIEPLVYASGSRGAAEHDRTLPYPVVRDRSRMLLPEPVLRRRLAGLVRSERIDGVWFGAAAPLGLLAPALRRAGAGRLVATTHGHEAGWAVLPGARRLLARIGRDVDVLTYLTDYTRRILGRAAPRARLERLVPGVDPDAFRPDPAARARVRSEHRLGERPVVVCVSRLVPRKGQDALVRALPAVRRAVPGTTLLLVGGGRDRARLEALARRGRVSDDVVLTGPRPWSDLPGCYAAGDVFAMPCRTRRGGLDVEGLGVVYLEASATGLPVVAGDSGGAPDAVLDGRTGTVVDGRDDGAVADALVRWLGDPAAARAAGRVGRDWVSREWTWPAAARRLATLLLA